MPYVTAGKGITRRSLLTSAGASVAGMLLAEHSLFAAQSSSTTTTTPVNTSASFASLKQIDAGLLNVGYAEVGAPKSFPVILLHGWPYDIYSFVDVAPLLASAGFRVIISSAMERRDFGQERRFGTGSSRQSLSMWSL